MLLKILEILIVGIILLPIVGGLVLKFLMRHR